jgi:hypothetical protein
MAIRRTGSLWYDNTQVVIEEISRGDSKAAKERLKAIKNFTELALTDEVFEISAVYQEEIKIPRKAYLDLFHISVAVIHEMDYILSWNFHHITNVFVKEKIRIINDRMGIITPVICTPEELIGADYHEKK